MNTEPSLIGVCFVNVNAVSLRDHDKLYKTYNYLVDSYEELAKKKKNQSTTLKKHMVSKTFSGDTYDDKESCSDEWDSSIDDNDDDDMPDGTETEISDSQMQLVRPNSYQSMRTNKHWAISNENINVQPLLKIENNENFFLATNPHTGIVEKPSSKSEYYEYKHLMKRNMITNILFDPVNGKIASFVAPVVPLERKVIIMPINFIKVSPYHGYFKLYNLTVRIYSKCLLSAKYTNPRDEEIVNDIRHISNSLLNYIKSFMHNLGFLFYVYSKRRNQFIAYNSKDLMVAVIGQFNNLQLMQQLQRSPMP